MKKSVLVLFASVLLSACTTGVTLLQSKSAARYYSYHGGQMPMIVHGNPFGGPKADFDQAVANSAQARLRNPSIAFTVHDRSAALPEFYTVMAFNAPQSQSPWGLCATDGRDFPTAVGGGQVGLLAAVCRGNNALGWANATAYDVTAVQSPSFQTFVSQTADATFQVQPSIRRHGDGANR